MAKSCSLRSFFFRVCVKAFPPQMRMQQEGICNACIPVCLNLIVFFGLIGQYKAIVKLITFNNTLPYGNFGVHISGVIIIF